MAVDAKTITVDEARAICKKFASDHKLIFEDGGECGFGRECVGFISKNGNWLDYHPLIMPNHDYLGVEPPDGVDAYHNHTCMAVLGRGDEAVIQLAEWVNSIKKAGNISILEYKTGATGIQAMMTGVTGYAIVAGNLKEE